MSTVLVSSAALLRQLQQLTFEDDEDSTVIEVRGGKMIIQGVTMHVEHKGTGDHCLRALSLKYLAGILTKMVDCPILLEFDGESLYLSQIPI